MIDFSTNPELTSEDFDPIQEEVERMAVPDTVASDLAAQAALLSGGDNIGDKYEEIKQTIVDTGSHPEVETIAANMKNQHDMTVVNAASEVVANGEAPAERVVDAAFASLNEWKPNMADEISVNAAAGYEPTTAEGKSVFDSWSAETFDKELEGYNELDSLMASAYEDMSLTWGMVGDGLLTFAPLYESFAFNKLAGEMGVKRGISTVILPGELVKDFRDTISTLPIDEKVLFFKDMSSFLEENSGVLGGNDFVRLTTLMSTFSEATSQRDPEDIDWDRWALDFTGLMDLTIVGGMALRGVMKVFKGSLGGLFKRVTTANPDAGAELAKVLANNPDKMSAVGETAESFRAKYVMPKDASWEVAQTPEKVRKAVLAADEEALDLLNIIERVEGVTGRESKKAAESLQAELSNAAGGTTWVADTSLVRTNSGWRASALVAASDESGWATKEAVDLANKELYGGTGVVVSRQKKTDKLGKPMVRKGEPVMEHFLKVEHNRKVVFMDDDTAMTVNVLGTRDYLFDPDSRFAKWISQRGNMVFDQYKLLEKRLEQKFNPIANLKSSDQVVVSKFLSKGLQDDKLYTANEIKRMALASGTSKANVPKVVEAYREARRGFDQMYLLENRLFNKQLDSEGFASVVKFGDEFTDFAKRVDQSEASNIKRVYNPKTKTIEGAPDLSPENWDNWQIVKTRSAHRVGGEQSHYVILEEGVSLGERPQRALSYHEGWLPTRYKENYYVTKNFTVKEQGSNKPVEHVISVARSKGEANKAAARLQANAEEGVTYGMKHDRKLGASDSEQMAYDLSKTQGQLFFSKRGERLKHQDGSLGRIEDPLEASINSIRTVSKRTAMDDFIRDLKSRYVNTYGDITGHRFADPSVAGLADKTSPRIAEAKSFHAYINQLEGFTGQGFDQKMAMIKLADSFEGWGMDTLAEGARWMSDKTDAISWVRARNFELNLGTDPLRQLILQPSQVLFTAALDPIDWINHFNRGRVVSGLATKEGINSVSVEKLNQLAKLNGLGIDGKELKKLIREFKDTGLGEAVTSHQLARDSAKSLELSADASKLEKGIAKAAKVYTVPVSKTRAFFERGEEMNLGAHWMLARARFAKNNPKLDPSDHILEISGEARSLALSMTGAGDFAYQKGAGALPLQYFAVRHKGFLAMTTSKTFTKAEKWKIRAGQLALWGPEGLSAGRFVNWAEEEYGIDLPDWFEQGLVETAMNTVLGTDLDLAGSFALISGIDEDNLVTNLFDMIKDGGNPSDLLVGATRNNYNRISNAFTSASILFNGKVGGANTDAIEGVVAEDFGRILSSYNRFAQGKAMLRSGSWMNSKGEALVPATALEAVFHGLLGLQSNKVNSLYDMTQDMNPSGTSVKVEIQETADDYYRAAMHIKNRMVGEAEAGAPLAEVRARYDALNAINNLIATSQGANSELIMEAVLKKVEAGSKDGKMDELLRGLQKITVNKGNMNVVERALDDKLITEEQAQGYRDVYNFYTGIE